MLLIQEAFSQTQPEMHFTNLSIQLASNCHSPEGCLLALLLFNIVVEILASDIRQRKMKRFSLTVSHSLDIIRS